MEKKLILIEGLPGAGKTTISNLVHKILLEQGITSKLYQEGDLDHPADYESVSCMGKEEYQLLKQKYPVFFDESIIKKDGQNYFIPYGKLKQRFQADFPDNLYNLLFEKDMYELPFVDNQKWITQNWKRFSEQAEKSSETYVFECCFIQNPVTIGMIKHGVPDNQVIQYVEGLEEKIFRLNPILIYVNQDDINATFTKAVEERPKEWSQGFIDYYTNQGYGKRHSLKGVNGTVEVLKARGELERKILDRLKLQKVVINNSQYDLNTAILQLQHILEK